MKKKKNGKFTTILLIVIFVAGLSLVLYPSVANYVNSKHSSRAITTYAEAVEKISPEEYDRLWAAAREYNENVWKDGGPHVLTEAEQKKYQSVLNITGDGVMGYIEIPSIDVSLPIYHGASDRVLQRAIGHMDWSSLPIGGEGTHCVLSGHRGLPSAKLFTNLDKLVEGDTFQLYVLNEVLTYEVDQILIVLPKETSNLKVEKGKDYCTLITCTPYGINTHRLLVRGHRIETEETPQLLHVVAEAVQIDQLLVALILGVPLIIIAFILVLTVMDKKRKSGRQEEKRPHGKKKNKRKKTPETQGEIHE